MKVKVIGVLMCLLLMLGTTVAFADGGNGNGGDSGGGDGNGGGGGQNKLKIEQIRVLNDLDRVGIEETIYLDFSNNVVNMKVKEINLTCFELVTAKGESVNFEVYLGDDQVDRAIRNTIEIRPVTQWLEATNYQLLISGDLTSKNGMHLGEDLVIDFTTEGDKEADRGVGVVLVAALFVAAVIGGFIIGRKRKKAAQ